MIDLLEVWDCPKCGTVLSDQIYHGESIDVEHDDIYEFVCCSKCNHEVKQRMTDGVPVYESVDHDRWLWAMGFYDDLINEDIPFP